MQQYFVADDLAGTTLMNLHDFGKPTQAGAIENAVADQYGTAMNNHQGAFNPALDQRARQLGVNEYAAPGVGEAYVTFRLGSAPKGAPLTDRYHGRNVNNPSKDTMWGEHWGGVIAKDGADTITLENYARNAEDPNYDQKTGADPRFYFQMYGAGAQSWHEKWAAVNAGQRSFVNPLTMTVSRPEVSDALAAGHHEDRARLHFGDGAAVADDVPDVVNAASEEDMTIAAYKALAFARNAALSDIGPHGSSRTSSWTVAIMNVKDNFPGCRQLCLLTVDLLQQTAAQRWKADALAEHGHQIDWIKDHHTLLASATAPVVVIKQLRKALAYAQDHVDNGRKGRKQRVRARLDAAKGVPGSPVTAAMKAHVVQTLMAVKT